MQVTFSATHLFKQTPAFVRRRGLPSLLLMGSIFSLSALDQRPVSLPMPTLSLPRNMPNEIEIEVEKVLKKAAKYEFHPNLLDTPYTIVVDKQGNNLLRIEHHINKGRHTITGSGLDLVFTLEPCELTNPQNQKMPVTYAEIDNVWIFSNEKGKPLARITMPVLSSNWGVVSGKIENMK
jgi:hypothetical protein